MGLCSSKPKPEEPTYYNPFDPNAQHLYRQTVYVDPKDGKPKRSKTIKQDPYKTVLPKHSNAYAPSPIIPQPPARSPSPVPAKLPAPAPAAIEVYKPLNRNPLPAPPRDIYAEKGAGTGTIRSHDRHDSTGKYDTLSSKFETFERAGDPLAGFEIPQLHQRKPSDRGHRGPLARIDNGRIIIDDTPESTPGRGAGPVLPPVGSGPIPLSPPDGPAPLPISGMWGEPGYQRIANPDAPWPPTSVSHLVTPTATAQLPPAAPSAQAPVLLDHPSVSAKKKKRSGLSGLFHSFVGPEEDTSDEEEERARAAVERARKQEELERAESLKERQALLDREREKEKQREKRASMKEKVKEKEPVPVAQPGAPQRKGSGGPLTYHFEIEDHPGFSLVSPHTVHYDGKLYPTAAHLLEAHKFLQNSDHPEAAEIIRMNENLPGMYAVGREFEANRRPDWDQVFFTKLDDTLYTKMIQHSAIREQLLNTGDASIVFVAEEPFWGDGAGKRMGHNELGKCLVRVRDRIRRGRVRHTTY